MSRSSPQQDARRQRVPAETAPRTIEAHAAPVRLPFVTIRAIVSSPHLLNHSSRIAGGQARPGLPLAVLPFPLVLRTKSGLVHQEVRDADESCIANDDGHGAEVCSRTFGAPPIASPITCGRTGLAESQGMWSLQDGPSRD